MKTDVIVYEKKNALTRIALLGAGEPQEFEFIKEIRPPKAIFIWAELRASLIWLTTKSVFSLTLTTAAKLF